MNSKKILAVIVLLVFAILASYSLPRAKYMGTGFISELNIPKEISGWTGKDVTLEVGLNMDEEKYNFVSGALAYQYVNNAGKRLLFIILDAGNFHHPKVCFTGAGFEISERPETEFHLQDQTLKTHTLFTERGSNNNISFYWIVIDKDIAHEWIEQKAKQLFFSIFGKKRVGLMVRIDIPIIESNIDEAAYLAQDFIYNLRQELPSEKADYIFGETN